VITLESREGGNYSDVLPHILCGFESELQTNPMPFHLESLWGATLMPIRGCAMDWDGTK